MRAALAARLTADVRFTWPVEASRVAPLDDADTPRAVIMVRGDVLTALVSEAPRKERRTATLTVHLVADATSGAVNQDELDDQAEIVEQIVIEDEDLGGVTERVAYRSTEVVVSGDGDEITGNLLVNFDATYVREYADRPSLDAALRVHVDTDLGPQPDGDIEQQDDIDLPQ